MYGGKGGWGFSLVLFFVCWPSCCLSGLPKDRSVMGIPPCVLGRWRMTHPTRNPGAWDIIKLARKRKREPKKQKREKADDDGRDRISKASSFLSVVFLALPKDRANKTADLISPSRKIDAVNDRKRQMVIGIQQQVKKLAGGVWNLIIQTQETRGWAAERDVRGLAEGRKEASGRGDIKEIDDGIPR